MVGQYERAAKRSIAPEENLTRKKARAVPVRDASLLLNTRAGELCLGQSRNSIST